MMHITFYHRILHLQLTRKLLFSHIQSFPLGLEDLIIFKKDILQYSRQAQMVESKSIALGCSKHLALAERKAVIALVKA